MKISLLLQREPFGDILERTLVSFFNEFYDDHFEVKWTANNYSMSNKHYHNSGQVWLCNPLINSIYLEKANKNIFNSIKGEYSHNPLKPWQTIFQKFYLYLAIKTRLGSFLAPYTVIISPKVFNAHNMLIIGGNNKIRVINEAEKTVFVILKNGFNKKYLTREIEIRQRYKYLPAPAIISIGNTNWYCEEYLEGVSPERLDNTLCNTILFEATQKLYKLLNDTMLKTNLRNYTDGLVARITKRLKTIRNTSAAQTKEIHQCVGIINNDIMIKSDSDKTDIYTAITHGDFHFGNILYDGEKVWIVDWEYSRRRQIAYDLFVLLLNPSIQKGFTSRFIKFADTDFNKICREFLLDWPSLNWENSKNRETMLKVFLLEWIDVLLEENDNPLFLKQTLGLNPFMAQIKELVNHPQFMD